MLHARWPARADNRQRANPADLWRLEWARKRLMRSYRILARLFAVPLADWNIARNQVQPFASSWKFYYLCPLSLGARMVLAMHFLEPAQRKMRIDLRGGDVSVA